MKVKDYKNTNFVSSCERTEQYVKFERLCKSEIKKQCKDNGINLHKFNGNHFCWSAVLEKDGKFIYVSMSDVRFFGNWYDAILIRTMAHEKDWSGGANHYCSFDEIGKQALQLHRERNKYAM